MAAAAPRTAGGTRPVIDDKSRQNSRGRAHVVARGRQTAQKSSARVDGGFGAHLFEELLDVDAVSAVAAAHHRSSPTSAAWPQRWRTLHKADGVM